MQKNSYEMEVLINGKPVKEYSHEQKVYIEGRKGTKFSIRLRNNSYSRKLFVLTVDGLSVVDGKQGDFDSPGYVVSPFNSVTIDGWRKSDHEVAEFYFSSPKDSYGKKVKKGKNLGVVGLAVFDEVYVPHVTYTTSGFGTGSSPYWTNGTFTTTTSGLDLNNSSTFNLRSDVSNLNSANFVSCCSSNEGSQPTQQLGTGWGEIKRSEVDKVTYNRSSSPTSVLEVFYNTREELIKAGIDLNKKPLYVAPRSFPGEDGYCQPPRY